LLSPFNAPMRLDAFDAPNWVLYLLIAVAAAATVMVAGYQHVGHDGALPTAADRQAAAAVAPSAPVRGEASVSRSASRRAEAGSLARAAALAQKRRAARAELRRAEHRRAEHRRAELRKAERRRAAHRSALRRQAERAAVSRLPAAPSDAGELVAAAQRSSVNAPGRCLEWSREQAGIPSKYADATTAWEHATGRRPADTSPPRGAAVYWTGGSSGYGHIAISLGGGMVRSSDAGGTGQVATVRISKLSSDWNLQYAGWANSINGYRIPGVARG
jgi:hypothetical protein